MLIHVETTTLSSIFLKLIALMAKCIHIVETTTILYAPLNTIHQLGLFFEKY